MGLAEYAAHGDVALLTLNRPPLNILNDELVADLADAVATAADPAVRAVVITGGQHFAAGADISGFAEAMASDAPQPQARSLAMMIRQFELLEKPTIAAISGFALGGGLELALAADFRYMAADAKVGQPEILLGLIPGAGGTQRLARIIGLQPAKELVFSGRQVAASEAKELGLADRIVAAEELLTAALDDAAGWAAGPTRAYWAAKQAMAGYGGSLEAGLELEQAAFDGLFRTDDARVGVNAFMNKDQARFSGR